MAHIRDISGVPPEMRKTEVKRTDSRKSERPASVKDKLEISPAAREMLGMTTEAAKIEHLDHVRKAETLKQERMELIRERIESNFYNDPDIIEKILDELMELPPFREDIDSDKGTDEDII
jgi:hypothetical protein